MTKNRPFDGWFEKYWPYGTNAHVAYDGMHGTVVGWYVTREGKPGLVIQQDATGIVHVYRESRVGSEEAQ